MACIGDYEIVRRTLRIPQVEGGQPYSVTLDAPTGKLVLSGGSSMGRGEPSADGTAWVVTGNNQSGNAQDVAVWIACARL
jgi:hypothetical protein